MVGTCGLEPQTSNLQSAEDLPSCASRAKTESLHVKLEVRNFHLDTELGILPLVKFTTIELTRNRRWRRESSALMIGSGSHPGGEPAFSFHLGSHVDCLHVIAPYRCQCRANA